MQQMYFADVQLSSSPHYIVEDGLSPKEYQSET